MPRGGARPNSGPKGGPSATRSIRLPVALWALLQDCSAASGESINALVRDAVEQALTVQALTEQAEARRLLQLSRENVRILAEKINNRGAAHELLLEACRYRIREWASAADSASVEGGEQYAFRTCADSMSEALMEIGEKDA